MDNSNSNDFYVLQKETKSLERLINESLNASIGIIPLLHKLYSVIAPTLLVAIMSMSGEGFLYFILMNMILSYTIIIGLKFLYSAKGLMPGKFVTLPFSWNKYIENLSVVSFGTILSNFSFYFKYILKFNFYAFLFSLPVYFLLVLLVSSRSLSESATNLLSLITIVFLNFYVLGYSMERAIKDESTTGWSNKERIFVSATLFFSAFLFGIPSVFAASIIRKHSSNPEINSISEIKSNLSSSEDEASSVIKNSISKESDYRQCPDCNQQIERLDEICKHCGEVVSPQFSKNKAENKKIAFINHALKKGYTPQQIAVLLNKIGIQATIENEVWNELLVNNEINNFNLKVS